MTTAILIGGLVLTAVLALVMVAREWRLPALAFGLFALPGNIDNLVPQMRLDPNPLPDASAAAVSVIDLLLLWAIVLTVRERRPSRVHVPILATAALLATAATVASLAAIAQGVEPLAGVRGAIVFLRVFGVLWLTGNLIETPRDAYRLALGLTAGGVVLVANGLYFSTTMGLDRFTAATFGRNTFALALVVATIAAASVVFHRWSRRHDSPRDLAIVVGAIVVGASTLFGAVATGTRMSMVAFVAAVGLALLLNRSWRTSDGIRRVGVVALVTVGIVTAAAVLTTDGLRSISIVTSSQELLTGATDPESLPEYSEIRSRGEFWDLALSMAVRDPITGVGPFQWNIERYGRGIDTPLVADPHNAYLQIAAEYGVIVAGLYLALLVGCLVVLVRALRRTDGVARADWAVTGLVAGALACVLADLTNSNLFHSRLGVVEWLLMGAAIVFLRAVHPADRPVLTTTSGAPAPIG